MSSGFGPQAGRMSFAKRYCAALIRLPVSVAEPKSKARIFAQYVPPQSAVHRPADISSAVRYRSDSRGEKDWPFSSFPSKSGNGAGGRKDPGSEQSSHFPWKENPGD